MNSRINFWRGTRPWAVPYCSATSRDTTSVEGPAAYFGTEMNSVRSVLDEKSFQNQDRFEAKSGSLGETANELGTSASAETEANGK